MTGNEKVKAVIAGEELTSVPRGEFSLNSSLCKRIAKTKGSTEDNLRKAVDKLGFDFYGLVPQYPAKRFIKYDEKGRKESQDYWGRTFWTTPGVNEQLISYPIEHKEQLKSYKFPKVNELSYYPDIKILREKNLYVFGVVDGVFQASARTMDLLDFLDLLEDEPGCLKNIFSQAVQFNYAAAKSLIELGVDAVMVADDISHYQGLFCSNQAFFKWVAPYQETLFNKISQLGKPIFFHSDGNIMPIMEWLGSTKVIGIHSLEPVPAMNLMYLKQQFGKRFVLIGGIGLTELDNNSVEGIKTLVSQRVELMNQGGRYLLSTASGFLDKEIDVNSIQAMYLFDK